MYMSYLITATVYGVGLSIIGTYFFYKMQDKFILAI